jgi:hypothetical protein
LLQTADAYATGLLLSSSDHAIVRPLNRPEVRAATGVENPPRIDGQEFRTEVYGLTALYARLSAEEQAKLVEPPFARKPVNVWLARDPSFSTFDPLAAALEAMAGVTCSTDLPTPQQQAEHDGVVVLVRNGLTPGLSNEDVSRLVLRPDAAPIPVLSLTAKLDGTERWANPAITAQRWPVPLRCLAEFVARL